MLIELVAKQVTRSYLVLECELNLSCVNFKCEIKKQVKLSGVVLIKRKVKKNKKNIYNTREERCYRIGDKQ